MIEYIYLLREREFIKTNENIYKIGRTAQPNLSRLLNYPNGTQLLFQMYCKDSNMLENKIIKLFEKKYILRKDIGNEYFEGNCNNMIRDIYENISEELFDTKIKEDIPILNEDKINNQQLKENKISKKEKKIINKKNIINNNTNNFMHRIYYCDKCNYETCDKSNYNRHLKSESHNRKIAKKDNLIKKCTETYIENNADKHNKETIIMDLLKKILT